MTFDSIISQYDERELEVDGEKVPYITMGTGKPLICLHGFPDHPYTFHAQALYFSSIGYRVIMPYLRGYWTTQSEGNKPKYICDAQLGLDITKFIEAYNVAEVTLLGHDWGCSAAYAAALIRPDLIKAGITISVPYGDILFKKLMGWSTQQRNSWYYFLLASSLGELALMANNFRLLDELWTSWTSEGWSISDHEMQELKKRFKVNRNFKTIASYYKNSLNSTVPEELKILQSKVGKQVIEMPWMYLHGVDDQCMDIAVGREMNKSLFKFLSYSEIENAGHFPHREQPKRVNEAIADFLSRIRME